MIRYYIIRLTLFFIFVLSAGFLYMAYKSPCRVYTSTFCSQHPYSIKITHNLSWNTIPKTPSIQMISGNYDCLRARLVKLLRALINKVGITPNRISVQPPDKTGDLFEFTADIPILKCQWKEMINLLEAIDHTRELLLINYFRFRVTDMRNPTTFSLTISMTAYADNSFKEFIVKSSASQKRELKELQLIRNLNPLKTQDFITNYFHIDGHDLCIHGTGDHEKLIALLKESPLIESTTLERIIQDRFTLRAIVTKSQLILKNEDKSSQSQTRNL